MATLTSELGVSGAVNLAHAARPDEGQNFVDAEACSRFQWHVSRFANSRHLILVEREVLIKNERTRRVTPEVEFAFAKVSAYIARDGQ